MIAFIVIALYIGASLIVAHYGDDRRAGYWGTFLMSLLLTPIITGVMLAAFRDRSRDLAADEEPPGA